MVNTYPDFLLLQAKFFSILSAIEFVEITLKKRIMSKALVLSGGAVKGCYQAGAIKAVFESGFIPDIMYGISVGSLNGAFIANQAGKLVAGGKKQLTQDDWLGIANNLQQFWFTNIQKPADVAIQRSVVSDVWELLWKKFNGLSDTTPINNEIDSIVDVTVAMQSPAKLVVGTVDFLSGNMIYASPGDVDFISYLKGSIAIPIAMPPSISKKGEVLFDGGTRDVAPLGYAINQGADNIIGIICQAEQLDPVQESANFNQGNLAQLAGRIEDIIVNQNVQNDSQWITFLNSVVNEARSKNISLDALKSYKIINHLLIQPDKDLTIDIASFTSAEIQADFQLGYTLAQTKLKGYTVNV